MSACVARNEPFPFIDIWHEGEFPDGGVVLASSPDYQPVHETDPETELDAEHGHDHEPGL